MNDILRKNILIGAGENVESSTLLMMVSDDLLPDTKVAFVKLKPFTHLMARDHLFHSYSLYWS